MTRANSVWVAPSATRFSCLCERCLDAGLHSGSSFLELVSSARVGGSLAADTDIGFVLCASGHEVVVRRVDRPPNLARGNARQLQLV
jgi:hypothetical protein